MKTLMSYNTIAAVPRAHIPIGHSGFENKQIIYDLLMVLFVMDNFNFPHILKLPPITLTYKCLTRNSGTLIFKCCCVKGCFSKVS